MKLITLFESEVPPKFEFDRSSFDDDLERFSTNSQGVHTHLLRLRDSFDDAKLILSRHFIDKGLAEYVRNPDKSKPVPEIDNKTVFAIYDYNHDAYYNTGPIGIRVLSQDPKVISKVKHLARRVVVLAKNIAAIENGRGGYRSVGANAYNQVMLELSSAQHKVTNPAITQCLAQLTHIQKTVGGITYWDGQKIDRNWKITSDTVPNDYQKQVLDWYNNALAVWASLCTFVPAHRASTVHQPITVYVPPYIIIYGDPHNKSKPTVRVAREMKLVDMRGAWFGNRVDMQFLDKTSLNEKDLSTIHELNILSAVMSMVTELLTRQDSN